MIDEDLHRPCDDHREQAERVRVLEEALREWMSVSDLAQDMTFAPVYKRTEKLLAPPPAEPEEVKA